MGRDWQSPIGNFYGSTLVRLRPEDTLAPTLAFVAALAVYDALKEVAPQIDLLIKWPNDILSGGAKISGILLERRDDAVIIGMGINLAFHPQGLGRPVTSLSALGVKPPTAQAFQPLLARCLSHWLGLWRGGSLPDILAAWQARAHAKGTSLSVNLPEGQSIEGVFDGLDAHGALQLRLADGAVRAIHAGDVFLI
jgi:BirA family transcriptional regulator, biotin operon repressor / biotin---[acetyl-CoA-carboxylase] ligase